ncbi:hypothetical protein HUN01_17350 [Nostoc edaphicum CCNP1411]|uniref:Uncharacterized protein n=1 Tax=Nostoc edaphicum CCNP1411 TaxID=1472755 RepID=A0A7D7QDV5_9NOSO|nr:hypothetical protein [Nostoc edaphicum]QMS89259.1 hypothetical protein HUN01_17350 [Nostoc edaphicum CCNP1411]
MKLTTFINSAAIIAFVALTSGIANAQPATNNNYASASITTDVKNEPIKLAVNSTTATSYLQPFNLVSLAYQGGLEQQGIPSGGNLIFERQNRNIVAEDLVKAAISANKLPPQILNDQNYLSAVKSQFTSLSRDLSN